MSQVQSMGIIAGGGRLPVQIASNLKAQGVRVIGVGLWDMYDEDFPDYCDTFDRAGLIQLGRWIRLVRRGGAKQAMLVGRVKKLRMYDPFLIFKQMPDLRAGRVWYIKTKNDKRTDTLLGAVADELLSGGLELIDTTKYIPELMADEGVMTKTQPTRKTMADIEFGLPIVSAMGGLDIGQSIAVKDRDVIAVEAIEGTDRMIARAGELCRSGGWVLIKASKPRQDMRFDVPTVGKLTIDNLKKCGAKCLAVEAGKVILLEKPEFLQAADAAGISVIGVKLCHDMSITAHTSNDSQVAE